MVYKSITYVLLMIPFYNSTINLSGLIIEEWIVEMLQSYTDSIQNQPNGYGVKFDCP